MIGQADAVRSVFEQCRARAGAGGSECPELDELAEAVQRDQAADYVWIPAADTAAPPPCRLFVDARKALSVGDYNHAWTLLQPRARPRRMCDELLALEHARFQWFREEYASALSELTLLEQAAEAVAVRLRAANVRVAVRLELATLVGLGLVQVPLQFVPDSQELARLAEEMEQLASRAEQVGDGECGAWARLDCAVARLLAGGSVALRELRARVDAIPPYALAHALRKLGGALAVVGRQRQAVDLLLEAHGRASAQYPHNFITLKSAVELLEVTAHSDAVYRRTLASLRVRESVRRFVQYQSAELHTPLFGRIDQICRRHLSASALDAARVISREDLRSVLLRLTWQQLEERVALPLLEWVFSSASLLPTGTPYFDLVARDQLNSGESREYGVQVKSGQQTIKLKDVPASETLRSKGYHGFVAFSVGRLGSKAQSQLRLLREEGFTVSDWTGERLLDVLFQYPAVFGGDAAALVALVTTRKSSRLA